MRIVVLALTVLVTSLCAFPARADVKHVVARGHTLEAIARRYHVTQKAIIDANHFVENNQTLYMKYVEQQNGAMRDMIRRLGEDVGRLEGIVSIGCL